MMSILFSQGGWNVMEPVGFGKRFAASLIDIVLIVIGGMILGGVLGGMLGTAGGAVMGAAEEDPEMMAVGAGIGGVFGAIAGMGLGIGAAGIIFLIWEGLTGAAAGKLILGIRIKNADGSPAPVGQLIGRSAVKQIASVLTLTASVTGISVLSTIGGFAGLIILLGFFCVLGANRQALHDMIVKTAVYPK
jgi:uncharacterized RDD family membrane protein YckC